MVPMADKSITHNIFRIQSADYIMGGITFIAVIEHMIPSKTLLDYSNLFSPNDYQKNGSIIYKYLNDKYDKRKRKPWLYTKINRSSYLLDELKRNDLMNKKHKKVCGTLNYFEHFLVFVSAVSGCVSISAFASLFGVSLVITSSSVWIKVCAITAEIKKYMSIIKKKWGKHDKIVLLAKTKLNTIEILISGTLLGSYIIHD